jgi:nucleotide-binding universal stress UspA family protein
MHTRRVLVPLDGSEFSRRALHTVRTLFDPSRCRVTLVRVGARQTPIATPRVPTYVADGWSRMTPSYRSEYDRELAEHPVIGSQVLDNRRTELLDGMMPDLRELRQAGFEVGAVVRFGDPVTEIANLADAEAFDIVVMASHGRTGLQRALLGSVAQGVLERAPVDVMLVQVGRRKAHVAVDRELVAAGSVDR